MTKQEKIWIKGEGIYDEFKRRLGITQPTQTPTTYTLEQFAKLKGEKLVQQLMLEYLDSRDFFEAATVLKR